MPRAPSKPWFAPKRYGYGAGLPIAWQGWVLLAGYFLVVIGSALGLPAVIPDTGVFLMVFIGIVLAATVVVMVICAAKIEGGWRWRWGPDD